MEIDYPHHGMSGKTSTKVVVSVIIKNVGSLDGNTIAANPMVNDSVVTVSDPRFSYSGHPK
jgi:hypothetical protein